MKERLVTPGPTIVPPEALLELARPVRHHRTRETRRVIAEATAGLKEILFTNGDVVLLTSSGTGAMEMAVANVVTPGATAIVLSAGKWGERWGELCRAFGANLVTLEADYGRAVAPDQLARALDEHPESVAVYSTLCETSTGVRHGIEAFGRLVEKTRALLVVDAISAVGAVECRVDDWTIDLLVAGSQKGLMLPPGLSCVAVSAKAREFVQARERAGVYYFDLKKALAAAAEHDTPFTPAHPLIAALTVTLGRLRSAGIETVWQRTRAMSRAMHAAAEAIGLATFADPPAAGLTVIRVPQTIDAARWSELLETKYGLKVAGGQGSLKGKILRIAHLGYLDALDVMGIVAALEWSLAELGFAFEPGSGAAAAARSFACDLPATGA